MEIKISPEIVVRSAQNWQQNLLYKSFKHPQNFVTLAVSLLEKINFLWFTIFGVLTERRLHMRLVRLSVVSIDA